MIICICLWFSLLKKKKDKSKSKRYWLTANIFPPSFLAWGWGQIMSVFFWVSFSMIIFWNYKQSHCILIFVFIYWRCLCPELCVSVFGFPQLCPSMHLLYVCFRHRIFEGSKYTPNPPETETWIFIFFSFYLPLSSMGGLLSWRARDWGGGQQCSLGDHV